MSTLRRRPKDAPPRRDRSDEFASFELPRPRAVMADLRRVEPPRQPVSLVPDLQPQRVAQTKTDAEAAYMGRVAALGCICCRLLGFGPTPAQVHHIRLSEGAGQRAGHHLTLPLCDPHHNGDHGIHGDRAVLRQLRMTEWDLLDITIGEVVACPA